MQIHTDLSYHLSLPLQDHLPTTEDQEKEGKKRKRLVLLYKQHPTSHLTFSLPTTCLANISPKVQSAYSCSPSQP